MLGVSASCSERSRLCQIPDHFSKVPTALTQRLLRATPWRIEVHVRTATVTGGRIYDGPLRCTRWPTKGAHGAFMPGGHARTEGGYGAPMPDGCITVGQGHASARPMALASELRWGESGAL